MRHSEGTIYTYSVIHWIAWNRPQLGLLFNLQTWGPDIGQYLHLYFPCLTFCIYLLDCENKIWSMHSMSVCWWVIMHSSLLHIIYCFPTSLSDNDVEVEDYVSYTLSIHSSVQLLFMDECEVNASGFPELMYAPADALITLAKQSKIKENDADISQSDIRLSHVSH